MQMKNLEFCPFYFVSFRQTIAMEYKIITQKSFVRCEIKRECSKLRKWNVFVQFCLNLISQWPSIKKWQANNEAPSRKSRQSILSNWHKTISRHLNFNHYQSTWPDWNLWAEFLFLQWTQFMDLTLLYNRQEILIFLGIKNVDATSRNWFVWFRMETFN